MTIRDYLAASGINLPGTVNPYIATGISADGMTIVGYTGNFTTAPQAFVVTIPSPGITPALGLMGFVLTHRRR